MGRRTTSTVASWRVSRTARVAPSVTADHAKMLRNRMHRVAEELCLLQNLNTYATARHVDGCQTWFKIRVTMSPKPVIVSCDITTMCLAPFPTPLASTAHLLHCGRSSLARLFLITS